MIPTDKLIITQAGTRDAKILTQLSITTFRDAFGPVNKQEDMDKYIAEEMNIERLTAELNDKDNLFFLVWYNGVLVGYAKLRTAKTPEELKNCNPVEIERLYIQQAYQSKKVGAAIMSYCIDYAKSQKYDTIWLGVWEHNNRAIKFYEEWDFVLFGAHSFVLGNDEQTDVLMKKILK